MITLIKRWVGQRKRESELFRIVQDRFRESYPNEQVVAWRTPIVSAGDGKFIVTVCYGSKRPPSRSWWIIDLERGSVEELPYEKASKLIDIPNWR